MTLMMFINLIRLPQNVVYKNGKDNVEIFKFIYGTYWCENNLKFKVTPFKRESDNINFHERLLISVLHDVQLKTADSSWVRHKS